MKNYKQEGPRKSKITRRKKRWRARERERERESQRHMIQQNGKDDTRDMRQREGREKKRAPSNCSCTLKLPHLVKQVGFWMRVSFKEPHDGSPLVRMLNLVNPSVSRSSLKLNRMLIAIP